MFHWGIRLSSRSGRPKERWVPYKTISCRTHQLSEIFNSSQKLSKSKLEAIIFGSVRWHKERNPHPQALLPGMHIGAVIIKQKRVTKPRRNEAKILSRPMPVDVGDCPKPSWRSSLLYQRLCNGVEAISRDGRKHY